MSDEHVKAMLPDHLRGRSITTRVIPMVSGLKVMLKHLVELNGDASLLRPWDKHCYKSYCMNEIQDLVLESYPEDWPEIMKEHLLRKDPCELGASAIDIYLVAYITENFGVGKDIFIHHIEEMGISTKASSAKAIWNIGKSDGVYLGVLNQDGSIRDFNFFSQWLQLDLFC
ncbi:MAG: hypothetical protein K2G70_04350 [Turicibacter sp.]|nr:hypothetical protein [Turicibacter sp.]